MINSIQKSFIPLIAFIVLGISSCKKDKCDQTVTYNTYVPVYMSYAQLRSSVKIGPAQPLKNPGKIYLIGNYILVNELNTGIHVIDNTNPSSPNNMVFISIPGNVDLSATGNTLYADSYIDLLVFDISNFANITLVKRIENALPYVYYNNNGYADSTKGVVSDWQVKPVTEKAIGDCNARMPNYLEGDVFTYTAGAGTQNQSGVPTGATQGAPGVGGSTARFTIANNALYIVDNSSLHIYDVSNTNNPQQVTSKYLGWSIETIFPYKNHLFIGSSSGFYIYDISNALNPSYISTYNHIAACDPVVVDDNYAYFTLNDDYPCHMGVNELDVVDITDMAHPQLKTTMAMLNPKGLGIDSKTLFICDSKDGLKVYNTTDVTQIKNNMVAHFSNINAFDVIPYNKHLVMTGSDGLYQYDYSNIQNITLLSKIAVQK